MIPSVGTIRSWPALIMRKSLRTTLGFAAYVVSVVDLYNDGGLRNPRLAIAHEIESDFLDVAQRQNEGMRGKGTK